MRVFGGIQLIPYIKWTYQINIYVKMKVDLSYLSKCMQFFLQILENKNLTRILARKVLKSQVFTRWFLMQLNAGLLQGFKQRELAPNGGRTIQALSDQINLVPRVLSVASRNNPGCSWSRDSQNVGANNDLPHGRCSKV